MHLAVLSFILIVFALPAHCWVGARLGNYSSEGSLITPEFTFDWITLAGAENGNDRPYSLAFDSTGDLIIAGSVANNARFGNISTRSPFSHSGFLAKADQKTGKWKWVSLMSPFDEESSASACDVDIDANDSVVVVGSFRGNLRLDSHRILSDLLRERDDVTIRHNDVILYGKRIATPLLPHYDVIVTLVLFLGNFAFGNIFITKYDSFGKLLWATQVDSNGTSLLWGSGIAFDVTSPTSDVYLCGYFAESAQFSDQFALYSPDVQMFLAKYNTSTGQVLWATQAQNSKGLPSYGIDLVAVNGTPVVIGTYFRSISFSPNVTLNTGDLIRGLFVAYFNGSNGHALSAFGISGEGICFNQHELIIDSIGDIYFAGCFGNSITFNNKDGSNKTLNGTGNLSNLYFAKYTANGTFEWAKYLNTSSTHFYNVALAVDELNNLYLSSFYMGGLSYNTHAIQLLASNYNGNAGNVGSFLIKVNTNGSLQWVCGLEGFVATAGVVVDQNGTIFATGSFSGFANFGPTSLWTSSEQIFLVRFSEYGQLAVIVNPSARVWKGVLMLPLFAFFLIALTYALWHHAKKHQWCTTSSSEDISLRQQNSSNLMIHNNINNSSFVSMRRVLSSPSLRRGSEGDVFPATYKHHSTMHPHPQYESIQ